MIYGLNRLPKKECFVCGIKKDLELHHKIPMEIGGLDLEENLIFLCHKHHIAFHKYFIRKNPCERDFINKLNLMKKECSVGKWLIH